MSANNLFLGTAVKKTPYDQGIKKEEPSSPFIKDQNPLSPVSKEEDSASPVMEDEDPAWQVPPLHGPFGGMFGRRTQDKLPPGVRAAGYAKAWDEEFRRMLPQSNTSWGLERFIHQPRPDIRARDALADYRLEGCNITTTRESIMRGELVAPAVLNPLLLGATITLYDDIEGSLEYFPWPLSHEATVQLIIKAERILGWQADLIPNWEQVKADKRYQAQWLALGTNCLPSHHPDFWDAVNFWLFNDPVTTAMQGRYCAVYDKVAEMLAPKVHGKHVLYQGVTNLASDGGNVEVSVDTLLLTCSKNLEAAKLDKGRCSDLLFREEMLLRNRYIREKEEEEEEEEERLAATPPPDQVWSGHGHPDDVYFGEANKQLEWGPEYFYKL